MAIAFDEKRRDAAYLRSRIRGCLYAGALGDALGYAVEFISYSAIRERFGPDGIRQMACVNGKAIISDDTQMTLFTNDAMIRGWERRKAGQPGGIQDYVYLSYLAWLNTQSDFPKPVPGWDMGLASVPELQRRRAPGNTCLWALGSRKMGTPEHPINDSKGCGGVMRTAPLGFDSRWGDPMTTGAQAAAITHGHSMGWVPAGVLSDMVYRCIYGDYASLQEVVEASMEAAQSRWGEVTGFPAFAGMMDLAMELSLHWEVPDEAAIRRIGEGWVGDEALAVAVYSCLRHPKDLRECLISAVNHSGDSDSTGAIAGNLLGAWLGDEALPADWLAQLELTQVLEAQADGMVNLLSD